jgi:hypothetical protein
MTLHKKAIVLRIDLSNETKTPRSVALRVTFNKSALTTQVHGNRTWDRPVVQNDRSVLFHARDRVLLKDWVEKKGTYLVNEDWQEKIFRKGSSRLRTKYLKGRALLYDAQIYALAGGKRFSGVNKTDKLIEFTSQEIPVGEGIRTLVFVVAFGDSQEEVCSNFRYSVRNHVRVKDSLRARYRKIDRSAPCLGLEGYPEIEEFFHLVPMVVESAKIPEKGVTRGCASSYYWVWGWDNIVTGLELSKWGDLSYQKKMVQFFATHRAHNGSVPHRFDRDFRSLQSVGFGTIDSLYIYLVFELFTQTRDIALLRDCYRSVKRTFLHMAAESDDRGFYKSLGMYPDFPRRLGRTDNSHVAMEIGTWYVTCRIVELIAAMLRDKPVADKAIVLGDRIRSNFALSFDDDSAGFLVDSVDASTGEKQHTHPIFSLMFLHSSFGFPLIQGKERGMCDFMEASHLSEHGVAMMPRGDQSRGSEIGTSSWYPHWDIYPVKLLRRLGRTSALLRWLELVKDCYRRLGYCPEFVSLKEEDIHPQRRWIHHGSPWNLNCTTGWYKALVEGIIGVESDIGGLTYIPCPLPFSTRLEGLRFRNTIWSVSSRGQGNHIEELIADGSSIRGTCKMPVSFYGRGRHSLQVNYGDRPQPYPVIRELIGGGILKVNAGKGKVAAVVKGWGTLDITFSARNRVLMLFDGIPVDYKWDDLRQVGWAQMMGSGMHRVELIEQRR